MQQNSNSSQDKSLHLVGFNFLGNQHTIVSGVLHILQTHAVHLAPCFINRYSIVMKNQYGSLVDLNAVQTMACFWDREISQLNIPNVEYYRSVVNSNTDNPITWLNDFSRLVMPHIATSVHWTII